MVPAVSTARSSDRPAPRKAPVKRSPAKKPALTLASNVSGDYAITAPSGTPKSSAGESGASRVAAANTLDETTTVTADASPPPLPSLSPGDAALQFETMPEAPEQRSVLDGQEPMRFVWSRRWPFLTLVAASQAPAPSAPSHAPDPGTDPLEERAVLLPSPSAFGSSEHGTASDGRDGEPDVVSPAESAVIAEEPAAPAQVDPPADPVAQASFSESAAGGLQPTESTEATVPQAIESDAAEVPAEQEAGPVLREAQAQNIPVPVEPVELVEPVEPVETAEPVDEPAAAESAVVGADAPVDLDVDATSVTELLDESEARGAVDVAPSENQKVDPATSPVVLRITGLSRRFGDTVAVDGIDLDVHEGSFYGIVGPNGAGKTTTLSMVTGLLRPDTGNITVHGVDVWKEPDVAKRSIGVLPDRLRLFDRLTGAQLLYYSGVLRGLDGATVRARTKDLARAFGLEDALNRLVTDYSAGMTKKVALAAAMIHSPRLLVLDEPFESVDPVSAANVIEILQKYVAHGGTVVLSSHGMDLIQRVCDHVAIIVHGKVLAAGAVDDVRGSGTLEERFVELAGGRKAAEGMEWLHSFSD